MFRFKAVLALPVCLLMLISNSIAYADSKLQGYAQKGAYIQGSELVINKLDKNFNPKKLKTLIGEVTNNQGRYKFKKIPWKGWTEINVTGLYFNELTGATSNTPLSLKSISRLKRYGVNKANTNLFTHLAAQRMKYRVANGEKRGKAWRNTQREIKRFFGLKRVLPRFGGLNALNLTKGSGWYRKDNAILLLFTGGFLSAGGNAAMLQNLADDFADDGQFNGVGLTAFNNIARQSASAELLNTLAANMMAFGISNPPNSDDLPALPEWVVTTEIDSTPPVITIIGANPIDIVQGASYIDDGATAIDDQDGEVAVETAGSVDTSVIGTYTITYTATDIAGNTSGATRIVNVTLAPDTTPPVISVNGDDVTLSVGDEYNDAGATAIDDRDGVVEVIVTGSVDTSVAGEYTILYTATDAAGNTAEASRTITVGDINELAPKLVADILAFRYSYAGYDGNTHILSANKSQNTATFRATDSTITIYMAYVNQGGVVTDWHISNFSVSKKRGAPRRPATPSALRHHVRINEEGDLTVEMDNLFSLFGVVSISFNVIASNDVDQSEMRITVKY